MANDRQQRSGSQLGMVRDRNCYGRLAFSALHHDMAPALPDLDEAVFGQNPANIASRQDPEPTQR